MWRTRALVRLRALAWWSVKMADPHPTHDFPEGAWFCTRCLTRRDDKFVALRCISDGPIYEDDPAAARACDVEQAE